MTQSAADHTSRALAEFAAGLRFDDLPPHVVQRAEELCLDWFGSALAGKGARPVRALERFVEVMGPRQGEAEILVSRRRTSPLFAALVNAASTHVVEQDDVHNGSVFHPGAVVFPPVLASAQQTSSSTRMCRIRSEWGGGEITMKVGGKILEPDPYFKVYCIL